jgi:RNA polymerase I-specific transcription initiation factor RRN7
VRLCVSPRFNDSNSLFFIATLYALTKRLSQALDLPLTVHPDLTRPLIRVWKADPTRHKYDNIAPEVGFACAVVIVLKMVYGFDGEMRSAVYNSRAL